MTTEEMLRMVYATHLPVVLPKLLTTPIDVDASIGRFLERAARPRPLPPLPEGYSVTVTSFTKPITCRADELGIEQRPVAFPLASGWGWWLA